LGAEHRQQVAGDEQRGQPGRLALRRRQRRLVGIQRAELIDLPCALPEVQQVRHRPRLVRGAAVTVGLPHGDETIGIGVGHRLQQHGVDHAEDGDDSAYADGQREDRGGRETGAGDQHAGGVSDVRRQAGERVRWLGGRRRRRSGGRGALAPQPRPQCVGVRQFRERNGQRVLLGPPGTPPLLEPLLEVVCKLLHDLRVVSRVPGDLAKPVAHQRIPVHLTPH
jgi:hypothetical protein